MRKFTTYLLLALIPGLALLFIVPSSDAAPATVHPNLQGSFGMRTNPGQLTNASWTQWENIVGNIEWTVIMPDKRNPENFVAATWGAVEKPDSLLQTRSDINAIITVPLAFGDGKSKDAAGKAAAKIRLQQTANGQWDAEFRKVAERLKRVGRGDAVIRLGHEFDGSWYPWSAQENGPAYIAAYRHVHGVFRSVSPDFRFDWNGSIFDWRAHGPQAYPGDAYVDIVGLDFYYKPGDGQSIALTDTRWQNLYQSRLQEHADFAKAHGKTVGYSEWGTFVDEPKFIERVHQFFTSLPANGPGSLEYQIYMNHKMEGVFNVSLSAHPKVKAKYLQLFTGAGANTPTPQISAPAPQTNTAPAPAPQQQVLAPQASAPEASAPQASASGQRTLMSLDRLHTKDDYFPTYPEADQQSILNQPNTYLGSGANYYAGKWYLRVDVRSKPSNKELYGQVCLWQHSGGTRFKYETCSRAKEVSIVSEGIHWFELGSPQAWWHKGTQNVNYGRQADVLRFMLKDPITNKLLYTKSCGAACFAGGPDGPVNQHMPIDMDVEVVMVAKGQTLQPGAAWQGCPTAWAPGCSGGVNGTRAGGGLGPIPTVSNPAPTNPTVPVPPAPTNPTPATPVAPTTPAAPPTGPAVIAANQLALYTTPGTASASKGGYLMTDARTYHWVSASCKAKLVNAGIAKVSVSWTQLTAGFTRLVTPPSGTCDAAVARLGAAEVGRAPVVPGFVLPSVPVLSPEAGVSGTGSGTPTAPSTPAPTTPTTTSGNGANVTIYVMARNDTALRGGFAVHADGTFEYITPACKRQLLEAGATKIRTFWSRIDGDFNRIASGSTDCVDMLAS